MVDIVELALSDGHDPGLNRRHHFSMKGRFGAVAWFREGRAPSGWCRCPEVVFILGWMSKSVPAVWL
ncbi:MULTISPECIES: hypothetical protein [unclassified Micromonospora]|uniref:hypothetical protein n=1 Tax=unclassified Micromonospora TaxID=2617518 RepID=UPI00241754F2|nr:MULTISPECIES: hypothetical protein [unclassified Micromonospora]MDG4817026.1 hypothetical protein [Micromonospora sp. WMMD956]WFE59604.1 hypothetical protein O7633_23350 [Micromonospora sp. WMMD712]